MAQCHVVRASVSVSSLFLSTPLPIPLAYLAASTISFLIRSCSGRGSCQNGLRAALPERDCNNRKTRITVVNTDGQGADEQTHCRMRAQQHSSFLQQRKTQRPNHERLQGIHAAGIPTISDNPHTQSTRIYTTCKVRDQLFIATKHQANGHCHNAGHLPL